MPLTLEVQRLLLALASLVVLASPARADDDPWRHRVEVAVGGGMSFQSAAPERFDMGIGGQLNGRAMLDLIHVRFDARYLMLDPSRPDLFELRGDGRLLFITIHDLTWRRTSTGELLRLFAGLGGEFDLPEHSGYMTLNVGFAMTRLGGFEQVARDFTEAYGAFAGVTTRLHIGPVRDELRVAVHAMMAPPELTLALALDPDSIFDQLVPGVTASNRIYLEVLSESVISCGPELFVSFEQLVEGLVMQGTLGVSGTLAI
ncbi:MAG: hypothetical protein AB7S26_05425 [Sandaracinaceae bacterium]